MNAIKLIIEQKIIERNRQDSGVKCLTSRLLNDIHDYMSVENNLERLKELKGDLEY